MRYAPLHRWVALLWLGTLCSLARADSHADILIVDILLNGQAQGDAFVLRDEDGNFYLESSWLRRREVLEPYPAGIEFRGRTYHPVTGLQGGAARFDALTMTLHVSVAPTALPVRFVQFDNLQPPRPDAATGIYVDYDFNYQHTENGLRNLSGLLNTNVFGNHGSVSADLLYRDSDGGTTSDPGTSPGGLTVLGVTYSRDDPDSITSLRLGDVFSDAGIMGRSLRIGGLQFGTNFNLRPSMITYPLPTFFGQATVPTALDVYVNGQLRHREQVSPGSYVLENVPVINGAGQMQVVATDALGRQQLFVQDYYVASSMLKRGLSEYNVAAGAIRENYGLENFDYRDFVAAGTWRYGYSNELTVEAHTETGDGVVMASGGAQYLLTRGGILSSSLGLSAGSPGNGASWLIGFEQMREIVNYRLRLTGSTRDFATVGMTDTPPELQFFGSAGFRLPIRATLGAAVSHERFRSRDERTVLSLTVSGTLENGLALSAFVSHIDAEERDVSAGIRFSFAFDSRRNLSGGLSRSLSRTSTQVEYHHSLPAGEGIGYRLAAGTSGNRFLDTGVIAQSGMGTYSLDVRNDEISGTQWQAGTFGSLVHVGGITNLSRRVSDAFAVVRVGEIEGVRVYLENREIGRTDETGRVFVPGLRPYLRNRLRIEPNDLPLTAVAEDFSADVAPYYRSGVTVDFSVRQTRDAIMRIVLPDGSPLPEGTVAQVLGRSERLPVGRNGRLYVRDIDRPSQVTLRWNGHVCDIIVPVPEGSGAIPNLGDIACEPRVFE